jgi:hypothetical protein
MLVGYPVPVGVGGYGIEVVIGFNMFLFRIFDELLEQQNSKEPVKLDNRETRLSEMQKAESYITSLRDAAGNQLLLSPAHRTGLLGLLSNISAYRHMFSQLVELGKLNELLPSQMSLDPLELFLGALRSSSGSNEPPTADQFGCAYKRHILHGSQGTLILSSAGI